MQLQQEQACPQCLLGGNDLRNNLPPDVLLRLMAVQATRDENSCLPEPLRHLIRSGDVARVGVGLSVIAIYPIYLESMVAPLRHAEVTEITLLWSLRVVGSKPGACLAPSAALDAPIPTGFSGL